MRAILSPRSMAKIQVRSAPQHSKLFLSLTPLPGLPLPQARTAPYPGGVSSFHPAFVSGPSLWPVFPSRNGFLPCFSLIKSSLGEHKVRPYGKNINLIANCYQTVKSKKPGLRGSVERRNPGRVSSSSLELYDVLGLGAFGALDHFEFHFLVFAQRAEALAHDGAVMHEDIGAVVPGDEAITLGIVKPFYFAGFLHGATSILVLLLRFPAQKAGSATVRHKKIGGDLTTPVRLATGMIDGPAL